MLKANSMTNLLTSLKLSQYHKAKMEELSKEIIGLDSLIRDLTKTMPAPVAKSYARKLVTAFLEAKMEEVAKRVEGMWKVVCNIHDTNFQKYGVCNDCDCAVAHRLGRGEVLKIIREEI